MSWIGHLGALITSKYGEVKEIDSKITKVNRMNYLLRTKQLPRTTKFRIYEIVIRPTALYGCETKVLNEENVKTMGKETTSKDIRGKRLKMGIYEEQTKRSMSSTQKPQIHSIIKARSLQWLGHMEWKAEKIEWSKSNHPIGKRYNFCKWCQMSIRFWYLWSEQTQNTNR